jgi:hypothetical protein
MIFIYFVRFCFLQKKLSISKTNKAITYKRCYNYIPLEDVELSSAEQDRIWMKTNGY